MNRKQVLSVVLVLVLVVSLSVSALAAEPTVYTNEELGYSFTTPEGCTAVVDGKNAQSLLDSTSKEVELTDQVKAIIEQAKSAPIVIMLLNMVKEKNFANNMNVVAQDLGVAATTADLLPLSSQLEAQYQSMFPGFALAAPCEIKTFGERDALTLRGEYQLQGIDLTICQGFFMEGTIMYNVTLTACREEFEACYPKLEGVLSTFQVAK